MLGPASVDIDLGSYPPVIVAKADSLKSDPLQAAKWLAVAKPEIENRRRDIPGFRPVGCFPIRPLPFLLRGAWCRLCRGYVTAQQSGRTRHAVHPSPARS